VAEGVAGDTYAIVLGRAPTAAVTVTVSPNAQLTETPTTLTFTPENWVRRSRLLSPASNVGRLGEGDATELVPGERRALRDAARARLRGELAGPVQVLASADSAGAAAVLADHQSLTANTSASPAPPRPD
jgi:hypothetical protein